MNELTNCVTDANILNLMHCPDLEPTLKHTDDHYQPTTTSETTSPTQIPSLKSYYATTPANMVSLLIIVLLIQIVFFAINSIGGKAINELLWQFSAKLPLTSSKDAKDQMRLRREVLRLKKEMNAISAQDDFARWAKIRRQHDKVLAEHDKKATDVSAHRNSFDTKANMARWTLTTGLQTLLQFRYSKTPIFVYPRGWMPWPVEWVLGFPRCPYGGVSINIWVMVCRSVVSLVGDALLESMGWAPQATQEKVKQKVAMGAGNKKI